MHKSMQLAAALAVLTASPLALSQPIVYPAKGQSLQQQHRDEGECYAWARSSTGP
jgi:hypothetical protein